MNYSSWWLIEVKELTTYIPKGTMDSIIINLSGHTMALRLTASKKKVPGESPGGGGGRGGRCIGPKAFPAPGVELVNLVEHVPMEMLMSKIRIWSFHNYY
jgi:hypothetical protein